MPLKQIRRPILAFMSSKAFLALTFLGNLFLLGIVTWVYFLEVETPSKINTYFDALWWGVTTITTVGYGDVVPTHPLARWLGLVLMYSGTVLFVAFTSLFASYWFRSSLSEEVKPIKTQLKQDLQETKDIEAILNRIEARLEALEKQGMKH